MQFFKFVILSITRILDELSFVLVDVILGYRHQVMHRSHELALDDHFSHPEEAASDSRCNSCLWGGR